MISSRAAGPSNNPDRIAFAQASGRSIEDLPLALKLNIIVGSTRPGRVGPVIAQWLKEAAEKHGKFAVELVDLADFDLPLLDEAAHPATRQYSNLPTKRWSASVSSADAFLFVTPEYDYFAPAALVNAVQVLLHEWVYKPAGVLSYGGVSGGLRSAQVLRQLLGNVNVHALPQVVPVHSFSQFIDNGVFDPNDQIRGGVNAMLDELHKWARALRSLRDEQAGDRAVRNAAA
jgi:NAD(P)H-dependent FMN reductase